MKLIVGLGNPGEKYKKSRHNFGFMAVDDLRKELDGSTWKMIKKYKAFISYAEYNEEKIVLMKPQTFMNLSGQAISSYCNYYKIKSKNLCVIHDDKDLILGKVRIRKTGSSGGHNGIKSIIENLGTNEFWRFRLGVSDPSLSKKHKDTTTLVLGNFMNKEKVVVNKILDKVTEEIITSLKKGEFEVTEYNI